MTHLNRITVDPHQCGGNPCIRGLRIRVKDILELLAAGSTSQEILEDYPWLEAQDIPAREMPEAQHRPDFFFP